MVVRLHTSPNDAVKRDKEGKKPVEKTTVKLERRTRTTANAIIKRETRGNAEVEENKRKPYDTTDHATSKWLPYADKEER